MCRFPALQIYYFQTVLNRKEVTSEEQDWLRGILFGLPLIYRERVLFPMRHHRLIDCIALCEKIFAGETGEHVRKAILDFFLIG